MAEAPQTSLAEGDALPNQIDFLSYDIERSYPVTPSIVFSRWLVPEVRTKWEAFGEDWMHRIIHSDARTGGYDEIAYTRPGSPDFTTRVDYLDIVTDARIVYAFSLLVGGRPVACSLTSIDLRIGGRGTVLNLRETISLLDGADVSDLQAQGIVGQLNPDPLGHGVLRDLSAQPAS